MNALTETSAVQARAGAVRTGIDAGVLAIDGTAEEARIAGWLALATARDLTRRGVIIAMSGGVDSSVCAALAVRALGPARVFGLIMPERDSSPAGTAVALDLARALGIDHRVVDIAPVLEALRCYRDRDAAIRRLVPAYDDGWTSKIVLDGGPHGGLSRFRLVVRAPDGGIETRRLPVREYLEIVAATNHKQRVRKTVEYHHADRLHHAVLGSPNRLEHELGFFVRNGDGSADLKPIAHLYKHQVYALARHLDLPAAIRDARPTMDTYSLAQGQDEFFFGLPWERMDLALYARDHGLAPAVLAATIDTTPERAAVIYADIDAKRRAARYLHGAPLRIETAAGVR